MILRSFGLGGDPLPAVVMPRLTGIDVVLRDNNPAVIIYAGSHFLVSKSFDRRCGALFRRFETSIWLNSPKA